MPRIICTLCLTCALATAGRAQSPVAPPAVAPADSARAAVLGRLPRGAWVRVTSGAADVTGTVGRADAAGVALRVRGGAEQVLAAEGIRAIRGARGRATGAGARRGAFAGGGAGLVLGWLAGGFWCEASCWKPQAQGAALGLAGGAAAGALVGAAVGTLVPRWRQLYP